jgi:flagellar hook assembly protein FlgD
MIFLGYVLVAGLHAIIWDGRNDSSEKVTSGAYFVRFEAGDLAVTKKLMFMR